MSRREAARQPRRSAITGPDDEPCAQAGSSIQHTTAQRSRARHASRDAEILLGLAMWLAGRQEWFSVEVDVARGKLGLDGPGAVDETVTVSLSLADLERLNGGLSRALSLLNRLTIDPSQIRLGAVEAPAARNRETLQ